MFDFEIRSIVGLIIGALVMTTNSFSQLQEMQNMLPASMNGWESEGDGEFYNPSNLYDYIDGGAEVYLAFNFKSLFTRTYKKPGEPEIIVDLFDMGRPEDAFGVYFNDKREGKSAEIGENSEWMDGSLFFHKGRYFVSILPFDDNQEIRDVVRELAKHLEAEIEAEDFQPELVRLIPSDRKIAPQIQYFHVWNSLNTYHYLANENILNLNITTEGILGTVYPEYSSNTPPLKSNPIFIIIKYPDEKSASEALANFNKNYLQNTDTKGIAILKNSLYTGAFNKLKYIVIVLDCNSLKEAKLILDSIADKIENKE